MLLRIQHTYNQEVKAERNLSSKIAKILIIISLCLFSVNELFAVNLDFSVPSGVIAENSHIYADLVKRFNKENPGITVKFKSFSMYDDVVGDVLKTVRTKKSAGIFIAEISESIELSEENAVIPIQSLYNTYPGELERLKRRFVPVFLGNSYSRDMQFVALPFYRSIPIVYYNLDILKKVGVTKQTLPKNDAQFEALLLKLQKKIKKPPLWLGGDWYDWIFETLIYLSGGELGKQSIITLNTTESVEALRHLKKLKDRKILGRPLGWRTTINGFLYSYYPIIIFSSGGMEIINSKARFNWCIGPLPKEKSFVVPHGGGNLYVSANMTQKEKVAAKKFIEFLYRPDVQASIAERSGYFPVIKDAYREPTMRERYSRNAPFIDAKGQLLFSRPKFATQNHIKIRKIIKAAIDRTLEGGMSPEVSLEIAQREAEKVLGQK